ncbi:MAG TPA: Gfo/Idh/MocA family oxidoreductase [Pirellulales bacterium]|jgi:predicted dehydrogenase|nr:Gfo/Idh/MocA family oxidoreductase [Pirellulales bacterium]
MADPTPPESLAPATRREFLKQSSLIVAGGTLAGALGTARSVHAAGSDTLKVGLIGCGGRGTGAAANALGADPNVKLTALADTFADQIEKSLEQLRPNLSDKIAVPDDHKFVGFDAYQKLLATDVDVVLLTTSPHFRPIHLQAAIAAGKHVFCEKPVAVDAPGIQSVLASVAEAKRKNLAVVSGLCYRYDLPKRELIQRVRDGAIGDIRTIHTSYNTGTLWHKGRKPEWSEMEYQIRNWLYFTWLSGDFNVEQHVHSLDKAAWALGDQSPERAYGLGGRQVRTGEEYGQAFDHMAVVYEFPGGVRVFANCRQMAGCSVDVSDHLFGTKGTAEMQKAVIEGENPWAYRGGKPNMYDVEHQEMFASIRSGNPINNGHYMANSTMMGIMGRMVCYTGQTLTWKDCIESKEDLSPPKYEWGPAPTAVVAKPGLTPFI